MKDKNIIIILDYYTKKTNSKKYNSLIELIFTIYHEIQHLYQEKYPQNNYIYFLMKIEKYIIINNPKYYQTYHDNFLIEIDANLYGITKTIDYLKNYPNYYLRNEEYLEKKQSEYLKNFKYYDEQIVFEEFHKIIKKDYKKILNEFKILNYFYKQNGEFQSLSDILENTKKYNIPSKITELIISSKSYTKEIDSLSNKNEKKIIKIKRNL